MHRRRLPPQQPGADLGARVEGRVLQRADQPRPAVLGPRRPLHAPEAARQGGGGRRFHVLDRAIGADAQGQRLRRPVAPQRVVQHRRLVRHRRPAPVPVDEIAVPAARRRHWCRNRPGRTSAAQGSPAPPRRASAPRSAASDAAPPHPAGSCASRSPAGSPAPCRAAATGSVPSPPRSGWSGHCRPIPSRSARSAGNPARVAAPCAAGPSSPSAAARRRARHSCSNGSPGRRRPSGATRHTRGRRPCR